MTKTEFLSMVRPPLDARYPNAALRAQSGDGGWVVEIVHPFFGKDPHAETKEAFRLLDAALAPHREFVWLLCTAQSEAERFTEHATLRTIPTRMVNGVMTSTLTIDDCYLDIPQFDAEVLQYSQTPEWDRRIEGVESASDSGTALLPFKSSSRYVTIEVGGTSYELEKQPDVVAAGARRRVIVTVAK